MVTYLMLLPPIKWWLTVRSFHHSQKNGKFFMTMLAPLSLHNLWNLCSREVTWHFKTIIFPLYHNVYGHMTYQGEIMWGHVTNKMHYTFTCKRPTQARCWIPVRGFHPWWHMVILWSLDQHEVTWKFETFIFPLWQDSKLTFSCWKLTIETLNKGVKYVQS